MDKTIITQRVEALRAWMREQGVDAFVVPLTDPHNSEYIADHWKCLEWLSGFTGSAATVVVAEDAACLWTDSRYWLQAAQQLDGTPFLLMRDGDKGVPSPEDWIEEKYGAGGTGRKAVVAATAETMAHDFLAAAPGEDEARGFTVRPVTDDPFDALWKDRPTLPRAAVEVQPLEHCGDTAHEKVALIAATLDGPDAIITDLSETAWALNLRGDDIAYNPVFMAYLYVHADGASTLCTDVEKLSPAVREYLETEAVDVLPYETGLRQLLEEAAREHRKVVAPNDCNSLIATMGRDILGGDFSLRPSVVAGMKAHKTEEEQAGFRTAMEKDGVALVSFLYQFYKRFPAAGGAWTELSVDDVLTAERARQEGFHGLSFATIAAYADHGAIVHYEADAETNVPIEGRSLLLIDSGAQFTEGTTDITRTLACGPLTEEERRVYTLVLKGHIGLSSLRFPEGTVGLELDLAARRPIWEGGYDFGHGTGHGVGSRLCVHEGPHQIRKNVRACTLIPFEPGMVVTDEPGVYVEGRFGVRIENTLLVVPDGETPFGHFCRFEPLTLCPIDLAPVDWSLITPEERQWLNDYHRMVFERLAPRIDDADVRAWLEEACAPV